MTHSSSSSTAAVIVEPCTATRCSQTLNLPPQPSNKTSPRIRLPPYWDRNPAVWFLQAESQFVLSGVCTEQCKYHLVVSALSPTAAEEVADLLSTPPPAPPYRDLKDALLERTTTSQPAHKQQLLSAEDSGDRRPNQLLRRIRQLMSSNTTGTDDRLLRELFMQRLPVNVQMVLATTTAMDLNSLASLADKVMEVVVPAECNVTPLNTTVSPVPQASSTAASPIDALYNHFAQLLYAAERHRTPPHHRMYHSVQEKNAPGLRHHHRYAFIIVASGRTHAIASALARGWETSRPTFNGDNRSGPKQKSLISCHGQNHRPAVPGGHWSRSQPYLVDTVAEVSIIPAQRSDRTTLPTSYLQAANGSRIPVYKLRSLTLNLSPCRVFRSVFLVADVRRALIGADFLNHNGLLDDVKCQRLLDTATLLSVQSVVSSNSPIVAPTTTVAGNPFACLLQKFPNLTRPPDWT